MVQLTETLTHETKTTLTPMITKEQYLEAKRIVEEYELEEYENGMREAEDELNDDDDYEPEECEDCGRIDCVCSFAMDCHCGAWVMGPKGMTHVADCIC